MIPFSPPRMDQKVVDEVAKALLSGWITTGPRTKKFEKEIAQYTGAKKAICFGSATAGIELVLRWYGIGPGDEVIIPAYTYCATANVVIHCGAKPVMVDTLKDGFNIDPRKIEAAITENTKVIIPVDIAGLPCDYDEIWGIIHRAKNLFKPGNDLQKKLGRIMLLADSAHGFGATYQGKKLGSLADGTGFSFHAVKNLTTAEGGAVCLNLPDDFDHEEAYRVLNVMSLHGQSKDALAKTQKGAWRYDVEMPGYKCNMTDIQAAIGLVELERYESETTPRRREICELYNEQFQKDSWALTPTFKTAEKNSSYHLYQLRIDGASEEQRDEIIRLIAEDDIAVNVHFIPLPMLTAYKNLGHTMSGLDHSFNLYQNEISLPLFYNLTDEQVNEVVRSVRQAVNSVLS